MAIQTRRVEAKGRDKSSTRTGVDLFPTRSGLFNLDSMTRLRSDQGHDLIRHGAKANVLEDHVRTNQEKTEMPVLLISHGDTMTRDHVRVVMNQLVDMASATGHESIR